MFTHIDLPEEQGGLLEEVVQLACDTWASTAPYAVIGEILVGNQDEVDRFPGALAVWMLTLYPTGWDRQHHRVAQCLQSSDGPLEGEALRYAELYGGIQYHTMTIGQFPDGLRVLTTHVNASPPTVKEMRQRWGPTTLEELREHLACLTEALAVPPPSEPKWQQAEQLIAKMYADLNALQILCQREGNINQVTMASTLNPLPCSFPVGDEDGTGVVWMNVEQSHYGVYVVIHKQRPDTHPGPCEGMAAVHVDYFNNRVQLQLYDEDYGPGGDTHWGRVEDPDGGREPLVLDLEENDCSIILVRDVEQWKEPRIEQ